MIFAMKKRVTHVAPLKLGLAMAMGFAVLGLVLVGINSWERYDSGYSYHEVPLRGNAPLPAGSGDTPPLQPASSQTVVAGDGVVYQLAESEWPDHAYLWFPFVFGLIGFAGGLLGALAFNLTAKWTGGIVINVEDIT
jgi:hypothetical protein